MVPYLSATSGLNCNKPAALVSGFCALGLNPDSEAIEDFLIGEGHRMNDCEWMSHSDGEIIIDKAEI